ncbi:zinc finger protein 189-like, partial [Notothenia coriiceps]|uniref:Zinc finger protein 189-like n=1 Tax=Notothenia coriiceps TaxID=8208 RepID=A0A6I9P8R5_9TELE
DAEELSPSAESRPHVHEDASQPKEEEEEEEEEEEGGVISSLINSDGEEESLGPSQIEQDGGSETEADGKNKYRCRVCGRNCFKTSALQKHLRIHSGEKPFQCPTCKKSFTQQVHMKEHQRTHSGERPYTCSTCSKSFTFSSAMRRHERQHSGVRFQCKFCSKSFSRPRIHLPHEDALRSLFCQICKKDLSGARVFHKHMKKHETSLDKERRTDRIMQMLQLQNE